MSRSDRLPASAPSGPVHCLAFDFGAGSGRAMLGRLTEQGLTLEELHRFDTATVVDAGETCWDLAALYDGLETGLRAAQALGPVHAIGIDSWGVDFGLIDAEGGYWRRHCIIATATAAAESCVGYSRRTTCIAAPARKSWS